MEWLGAGMSLVKRSAYDACGGFSEFFLHRCTTNEDVDFGIKLRRQGRILLCPAAKLAHYHAPGGRLSPRRTAEDDLFNRFVIMHRTQGQSIGAAMLLVLLFFSLETASSFAGSFRRLRVNGSCSRACGRIVALVKITGYAVSARRTRGG